MRKILVLAGILLLNACSGNPAIRRELKADVESSGPLAWKVEWVNPSEITDLAIQLNPTQELPRSDPPPLTYLRVEVHNTGPDAVGLFSPALTASGEESYEPITLSQWKERYPSPDYSLYQYKQLFAPRVGNALHKTEELLVLPSGNKAHFLLPFPFIPPVEKKISITLHAEISGERVALSREYRFTEQRSDYKKLQ